MMEHHWYRGHEIVKASATAPGRYTDNGRLVPEDLNRDCGYCGKPQTPEGHDGCLSTLPGLMNACCGHGVEAEAYVQYLNGESVSGREAVLVQHHLRQEL